LEGQSLRFIGASGGRNSGHISTTTLQNNTHNEAVEFLRMAEIVYRDSAGIEAGSQPATFPTLILVFGLLMIWVFGFDTLGVRLQTQLEGTVIASRDIPPTRGPRYLTEYTLRGEDDRNSTYVAGPNDGSLPRSMPVGTYLKKLRWHVYYERDGRRIDDFPLLFYQVSLGIAVISIALGGYLLWRGH
jgi:hypothetical protein